MSRQQLWFHVTSLPLAQGQNLSVHFGTCSRTLWDPWIGDRLKVQNAQSCYKHKNFQDRTILVWYFCISIRYNCVWIKQWRVEIWCNSLFFLMTALQTWKKEFGNYTEKDILHLKSVQSDVCWNWFLWMVIFGLF